MKVLANDGISALGEKILKEAGYHIETNNVAQAELESYINNNKIDVVLVRSATTVRKDLIDACPGLKGIGRGGVGMDNIDVDYARDNGRLVFNTPGASSQAVAELVIAHMMSMARDLFDANRNMPSKGDTEFKVLKKKYAKGIELRGKTMGIIGLGRIGQQTAKYALGLGMNVIGSDPFMDSVNIDVQVGGQTVSVTINSEERDAVLEKSDFISLHVPAQANGQPVIGKSELEKMKEGVILINLARGGIIDESELLQALDAGKVRAAGIDVFKNEPTPSSNLLAHPKISLTPHIGAATVEAQDRIGEELAEFIMSNFPLNG
ncbi:MAG: D-2-hydroxyacid dehydrogenase [Salibacteraceae bacterium]